MNSTVEDDAKGQQKHALQRAAEEIERRLIEQGYTVKPIQPESSAHLQATFVPRRGEQEKN